MGAKVPGIGTLGASKGLGLFTAEDILGVHTTRGCFLGPQLEELIIEKEAKNKRTCHLLRASLVVKLGYSNCICCAWLRQQGTAVVLGAGMKSKQEFEAALGGPQRCINPQKSGSKRHILFGCLMRVELIVDHKCNACSRNEF